MSSQLDTLAGVAWNFSWNLFWKTFRVKIEELEGRELHQAHAQGLIRLLSDRLLNFSSYRLCHCLGLLHHGIEPLRLE